MEIWKDIKDYEGLYQISNLGRVRSLERTMHKRKCENKILTLTSDRNGYLRVGLCSNGKRINAYVHRLVAQAFIPNYDNLPMVNHKDENKQNNCVDNLEWITNLNNLNYGLHNLRKSVSLTLYYLKKDKPEETEIIKLLEDFKKKI